MNNNKQKGIEEFLRKREGRVTVLIEMNITLYKSIAIDFMQARQTKKSLLDNFNSGCIYQFCAYLQKILIDTICVNFITVIGSPDSQ